MTAKSRIHAVLDWLRAGYPGGVPGPDRVPLLSLLRSTPLTDDEIKEVVRQIAATEARVAEGHLIDSDEIEAFVEGLTHHDAGPENVRRVAAKLAAAGWPLAGIDDDEKSGNGRPRPTRRPLIARGPTAVHPAAAGPLEASQILRYR